MALDTAGLSLEAQGANQFFGDMRRAEGAVNSFTDTTEKAGGRVGAFGEMVTGGLRRAGEAVVNFGFEAGKALLSFAGDSIGVAGDFEAGMNRFGAAAGDALEEAEIPLEDFRDLFIDIGKELPVSTQDVQDAAIALVKGGLDPAILAAGGLKDAIQFAAAAELDLAFAAELGVKQLGVWVSATASAEEQTRFLAMSQDLLVKAAGASTLNVDNLAAAMNVAGGQAKALDLDYRDFVTGITLISPAFNSAQEAGTGFKNFLARIQPSTNPAKDAMMELGLWTKETGSAFFDASGEYVGNAQAAELLKQATAGLTAEQRGQALQTIFGNDAMGAAVALASSGAEGYTILAEKIDQASGVSATAAAKQQGFNTAMDNFKGSVEAAQIILGTHLLPVLTDLLNNYITPGVNLFSTFTDAVLGSKEAAQELSTPMLGALRIFQGLGDLVTGGTIDRLRGGIILAFGQETRAQIFGFIETARDVIDTVQGVIDVVADVGGAFITLVRGGGGLGETVNAVRILADIFGADLTGAFLDIIAIVRDQLEKNFQNVVNIVQTVIGVVSDVVRSFTTGGEAAGALGTVLTDLVGVWAAVQETIRTVSQAILGIITSVFQGVIGPFIKTHGDEIKTFLGDAWSNIVEIITVALELIRGIVMGVFAVVKSFIDEHGKEIQLILDAAWRIISNIIMGALEIIKGILQAALKVFQGDWQGAWDTIRTMSEGVVKRIWEVIKATLDLIAGFFGTSLSGIVDTWKHNFEQLPKVALAIGRQLYDAGEALIQNVWDGMKKKWEDFESWLRAQWESVTDILPGSEPKDPSSPLRNLSNRGAAFITNLLDGMRDALPELLKFTSDMGKDLVENIKDATDQISEVIADALSGQASYTRQQADNMAQLEELRADLDPTNFAVLETSLRGALGASQQYTDPEQATRYYDLLSRHAFELADIRAQIAEEEDHATRERMYDQMRLIQQAQEAEIAAFQERASTQDNPMQALYEDIQAMLSSIEITGDMPASITALYEQLVQLAAFISSTSGRASGGPVEAGRGYIVGEDGPEYFVPRQDGMVLSNAMSDAWQRAISPVASAQQMMGGPTYNYYGQVGSNYNMPVQTNNSPAALFQSYQSLRAAAGWGA